MDNKGWIETTPEGVQLVHWFDRKGNEHVNGMGVTSDERRADEQ